MILLQVINISLPEVQQDGLPVVILLDHVCESEVKSSTCSGRGSPGLPQVTVIAGVARRTSGRQNKNDTVSFTLTVEKSHIITVALPLDQEEVERSVGVFVFNKLQHVSLGTFLNIVHYYYKLNSLL